MASDPFSGCGDDMCMRAIRALAHEFDSLTEAKSESFRYDKCATAFFVTTNYPPA
jgi:hypothetical protein